MTDIEKIKNDSYQLLDIIVKNNPSFGNKGKLGNVSIQVLKEIQGKIINLDI